MSLRLKFNLVMVVAFLAGLGIAALFASRNAEENARNQVLQEATLLLQQADAVRGYTEREVRPLLDEQNATRFLPHTVPSWAAQQVLKTLQRSFPAYDYKEAALNPTNPADRATDWEADIINLFRRDTALREHVGVRASAAGPVLTFARPIRIADQGCLTCHSTPAAAPQTMIELYGPGNGFNWRLGEAVGAQIVSVPMAVPLERAGRQFTALLASLGITFAIMLVLLNLLLHVFVIRPIQRMTAAAERVAAGGMEEPEFAAGGRDEIASLGRSFNLMRRSLTNAMKLLEG